MGANYSFEVKNIEIWVPTFFKHNNSFIATVFYLLLGTPAFYCMLIQKCRLSRSQVYLEHILVTKIGTCTTELAISGTVCRWCGLLYLYFRVTSLEQLSLAEFSGE